MDLLSKLDEALKNAEERLKEYIHTTAESTRISREKGLRYVRSTRVRNPRVPLSKFTLENKAMCTVKMADVIICDQSDSNLDGEPSNYTMKIAANAVPSSQQTDIYKMSQVSEQTNSYMKPTQRSKESASNVEEAESEKAKETTLMGTTMNIVVLGGSDSNNKSEFNQDIIRISATNQDDIKNSANNQDDTRNETTNEAETNKDDTKADVKTSDTPQDSIAPNTSETNTLSLYTQSPTIGPYKHTEMSVYSDTTNSIHSVAVGRRLSTPISYVLSGSFARETFAPKPDMSKIDQLLVDKKEIYSAIQDESLRQGLEGIDEQILKTFTEEIHTCGGARAQTSTGDDLKEILELEDDKASQIVERYFKEDVFANGKDEIRTKITCLARNREFIRDLLGLVSITKSNAGHNDFSAEMMERIFLVLNKGDIQSDERFIKILDKTIATLSKSRDPFTCRVTVNIAICRKYVEDFIELKRIIEEFIKLRV